MKNETRRATRASAIRVALLVLLCARCSDADTVPTSTPRSEPVRLTLQAIVVSDDDGSRPGRLDLEGFADWIDFANRTYAAAGVGFDFDPSRDVAELNSTALNDATTEDRPNWSAAKRAGSEAAARYPGKLVVFLRHGPGASPTGQGFSALDYAFVVLPGQGQVHCDAPHDRILAHEIGHFLGLSHTFVGEPFEESDTAEFHFVAHDRDPSIFDGDGLEDTPPDPAVRSMECASQAQLELAGVSFDLPRGNVMSYYKDGGELSPQQQRIVRWVVRERMRSPELRLPTNRWDGALAEAEELELIEARDADASVQAMTGWVPGGWSGDAQRFVGASTGGQVTFRVLLPSEPREAVLLATRAPDFGRVRVYLDDRPLGQEIDLYAPIVVPTGPLPLGRLGGVFREGRLTIRVVGKNPASSATSFGIDALGMQAP